MMRGVGVVLLALLALIHMSSGLSCQTCGSRKCPQLRCPLGVEKDVCNCCDRCLKGLGEPCAGIWNIKGSCAPGLVCSNPSTVPVPNQPPGVCIIPGKQTGY
ncbi:venom protein 302 [Procambarus clarkii]|uniref:venom protein 302 n=1 Tax=Procambarus clarkii TaxID=6728 RepID=UPI001E670875|nr:venom protein 302-like [Procambarus clarkii]XP_045601890.1 venom protein 302-like [Procambarus clarkii]